MENVSVFDVGGGTAVAMAADSMTGAAAQMAVACRKDARLCLRVCNTDDANGITVRLIAGGGPRAVLGDKDIAVGAGETAYIALFDTARFKQPDSGSVNVALLDADGDALAAPALANVAIEAVQL